MRQKCFGALSKLRRYRKVLPIALKRKLFQAFVLPHVDYCAVVWQECTKELQTKVERILNYGMRLILSQPPRTPSGEMRRTLHWMPLERRRVMFWLILLHRCLNNLAPAYLTQSFHRNCSLGYARTRGSDNPHIFPVKSEWGRRSFFFRASLDWSNLPPEIRSIKSVPLFKNALKSYFMN